MFLSIIIPIYNVDKYIADCLESLINQDISENDYEIICVDDGSKDSSYDIVKTYASIHSNILVVRQENAGVSVARNKGMSLAQGEYYWFVDGDDFVRENSLGKLKELCEINNCDVLSFRLFYFDDEKANEIKEKLKREIIESNTTLRTQQSMLIKRELIGELRWREGIEVGEDSIFMRELAMKGYRPFEIEDTVYFYRQHSSSAIHHGGRTNKRMFSHVKGAIIAKSIYDLPDGQCEANANLLRMFVIYAMVAIAYNGHKEGRQALKMMKQAGLFPFKIPKEATSKNSFHTTRTDFIGKVYGFLCIHSGTRCGLVALKIYYMLFDVIKGQKR